MCFYEKQLCKKEVVLSVSCNLYGKGSDDEENCLHIEKTFGYESIYFSDMDSLSIDICEECLFLFLKERSLSGTCITSYYANTQEACPP